MKKIEFKVEGVPVPKGRARVTTRGGFARAYTPSKTVAYEALVKSAGIFAMNGEMPLKTALWVSVRVYLSFPKSATKKFRAAALAGERFHTKKPDIDNIVKSVLDALNEICYDDDSQIVRLSAHKQYSDTPCVTVWIEELLP